MKKHFFILFINRELKEEKSFYTQKSIDYIIHFS